MQRERNYRGLGINAYWGVHWISLLRLSYCSYTDSYLLGGKGSTTWVFRARNSYSQGFVNVRNWICLFGAGSNAVNQLTWWVFASILLTCLCLMFSLLSLSFTFFQPLLFQHFLHDEPVISVEYEAQLQKTILPRECLLIFFSLSINHQPSPIFRSRLLSTTISICFGQFYIAGYNITWSRLIHATFHLIEFYGILTSNNDLFPSSPTSSLQFYVINLLSSNRLLSFHSRLLPTTISTRSGRFYMAGNIISWSRFYPPHYSLIEFYDF